MNKSPNDEYVVLPKDVYVLNTLAMGVAIQILAKITKEEIGAWKQYIGVRANEQYKLLSAQEIQNIVDSLEKSRTA